MFRNYEDGINVNSVSHRHLLHLTKVFKKCMNEDLIHKLLTTNKLEEFKELSKENRQLSNILTLVDHYEKLKKEHYFIINSIRYTYTDDEYGAAARKLYEEKGSLRYAYEGDAGFDLATILSNEELKLGHKKIWPNERDFVHTGLIFEFPIGYHGRIIHRSSTEKIHRIRIIEATMDDYRGEGLIQVANNNSCHVEIQHGHKLAQMVVLPNAGFKIEYTDELRPSKRSNKGWGSSGK